RTPPVQLAPSLAALPDRGRQPTPSCLACRQGSLQSIASWRWPVGGGSGALLVLVQISNEDLALRLGAQQQSNHDARRPKDGAHEHGQGKSQMLHDREVGDHRWNETSEDCTLMIAEGARRAAHFGGKALGQIARVLTIDGPAEESLNDKSGYDPAHVACEQIDWCRHTPEEGRNDDRPATANAIG